MKSEVTLHFFCGKMAAGKSTLAIKLATIHDAVLLSEDVWLAQLFPDEITDIQTYLKYSSRLHDVLAYHVQSLLGHGLSVVLDFPANTINQRTWFRRIFTQADVAHVLHYVDMSDAVCKHQLKQRSQRLPEGSAFTSEAEFDLMTTYFQPPTQKENFNVMLYNSES